MDINVTGVWEYNVTGQGVTVVVVDDGVEHTHQDIQSNYVSLKKERSFLLKPRPDGLSHKAVSDLAQPLSLEPGGQL